MRITVIGGAGYVGLITAVGFAQLGNDVVAVDINQEAVNLLSAGRPIIHEEGLETALNAVISAGTIRFTTDLVDSVRGARVIFVAVGTPPHEDGSPNVTALREVAKNLAATVESGTIVAIKSTVPIGTVSEIEETLAFHGASDIEVIFNPEFLSEGTALKDFFHPNRIILSASSPRAAATMRELYAPFLSGGGHLHPEIDMKRDVLLVETGIENAQIIKYASNAFLATRISFVNEIASICEHLGADVSMVMKGLGMDPRIGSTYLSPGIGFGGPCLEKDLQALTFSAAIHGYKANFLEAALRRNDDQVNHIIDRARTLCGGSLSGRRIAALGLAFKPGTNDVRSSLSVRIIDRLLNLGAQVAMHDPVAIAEATTLLPAAEPAATPYAAASGADLLLVLTDWPEYKNLDWAQIATVLRGTAIFDGRNSLNPVVITAAGLTYNGVGTGTSVA
jgi:UDPglucose 6-dehydrogenase